MKIAVIGAGAIGVTHCATIARTDGFELAGVADPSAAGPQVAAQYGTRHYSDYRELLKNENPDGAVVATPNELHVSIGRAFLEAGKPVIVEKPIANSTEEAALLIEAAEKTGVPLLVGHHRRHHPYIQKAKQLIGAGELGRMVMATVNYCLMKPDDYFAAEWRRKPGIGGPFLINLIHEIDLLRYLLGEVVSVSAVSSNAVRGFEVEDTGAVIFQFDTGVLATVTVSDTVSAPWSWDLASGDVPRFPKHNVTSHMFSGTHGGLTLPTLELWHHEGARSWNNRLHMQKVECALEDPFIRQLHHFGEVIAGKAEPLVSGVEGARNLAVLNAIYEAASSGRSVAVEKIGA